MNRNFRVPARADILEQYMYFEAGSIATAERFLESIEAAMAQLALHPQIGAVKHTRQVQLKGLRAWPLPGFPAIRMYYLIFDDTIDVLRVLHGSRDLETILGLVMNV